MSEREPALLVDPPGSGPTPSETDSADTARVGSATVVFPSDREREAEAAKAQKPAAVIVDSGPIAAKPEAVIVDSGPVVVKRQAPDPDTVAGAPVRRREATTVHVVGFWRRLAAAAIDFAVIIPATLLVTLLASKISGVHMPPSNLHLLDIDLWIDLVLATDPAIVMAIVLFLAIGLTYLLVFQITVGRTLGMRVLRLRIIDVYGDRPSPARCIARCAGYLASAATLFLGFLWMGFDSEKRGLQDWIAGTYVIRA